MRLLRSNSARLVVSGQSSSKHDRWVSPHSPQHEYSGRVTSMHTTNQSLWRMMLPPQTLSSICLVTLLIICLKTTDPNSGRVMPKRLSLNIMIQDTVCIRRVLPRLDEVPPQLLPTSLRSHSGFTTSRSWLDYSKGSPKLTVPKLFSKVLLTV